jgi:hypothetical protein
MRKNRAEEKRPQGNKKERRKSGQKRPETGEEE